MMSPIEALSDPRIAGVEPFSEKPYLDARVLYVLPYEYTRIFQLLGNFNDPAWRMISNKPSHIILSSERMCIPRFDIDCEVIRYARAFLHFPRKNNVLFYGEMDAGKALEVAYVTRLKKTDGTFLSVHHYGYVDPAKYKAEVKRYASCHRYALIRKVRWLTGIYLQRDVRRPSTGVARAFFICYNRAVLCAVDKAPEQSLPLVRRVDAVCRKGMDHHALIGIAIEQIFLLFSEGESVCYTPIVVDLLFETLSRLFPLAPNSHLGYMRDLFHLFCAFVLIPVAVISMIPLRSECEALPEVMLNQSGMVDEFSF